MAEGTTALAPDEVKDQNAENIVIKDPALENEIDAPSYDDKPEETPDTSENDQETKDEGTKDNEPEEKPDDTPDEDQETKDESGEEESSEDGPSEEEGDEAKSSEKKEEPEKTPSFDFNSLKEETGVEVEDVDGLKKALSDYKDLQSKYEELSKKDPLESLPKEIQEAVKYQKAGGDLAHYFSLRGKNFESMEEKDVLREKYFKDNAELYKKNPKLANIRFEKDYKSKFGVLETPHFEDDDEQTAEEKRRAFLSKNAQDIEEAKELKTYEVSTARDELKQWQEESTTPQTPTGLSDEEVQKGIKEYHTKVDETLKDFETVEIPVSDKKDENFKYNLSDEDKSYLKERMSEPRKLLEDIGIVQDKPLDVDKMKEAAMAMRLVKNGVVKLAKDYILEKFNKETIETKLENPKDPETAKGTPDNKSFDEKLAEAFEKKRQEIEN